MTSCLWWNADQAKSNHSNSISLVLSFSLLLQLIQLVWPSRDEVWAGTCLFLFTQGIRTLVFVSWQMWLWGSVSLGERVSYFSPCLKFVTLYLKWRCKKSTGNFAPVATARLLCGATVLIGRVINKIHEVLQTTRPRPWWNATQLITWIFQVALVVILKIYVWECSSHIS